MVEGVPQWGLLAAAVVAAVTMLTSIRLTYATDSSMRP